MALRMVCTVDPTLAPDDRIDFLALVSIIRSLHEWLEVCDERHSLPRNHHSQQLDQNHDPQYVHCEVKPIAAREPQDIPNWVIDTERGCLVAGHTVPRYSALSYTWNPPPQPSRPSSLRKRHDVDNIPTKRLMLERKDLDSFQQPGYLFDHVSKKIPAVIKDAMTLVSEAGTRYLWVDCLCVVQNDESTQDQLGRMRAIYSGAHYTIIAASSSVRLFENVGENLHYRLLGQESTSALQGKHFNSYWATRGWTYQEYLLSTRSIIFLDTAFFWECQCAVWREGCSTHEKLDRRTMCHAQYDSFPYYDSKERKFRGNHNRALLFFPLPDFRLYMELICQYNTRDLSYPQDALPAFSGVLDWLSQSMFPGGFVGALPNLFLDSTLLWQPLREGDRRKIAGQNGSVTQSWPLPSWSWVGWKCAIDPQSLASSLDYRVPRSDTPRKSERNTWITRKTVTWFAQTSTSAPKQIIEGPDILEELKGFRANADKTPLPEEWSQHFSDLSANKPPEETDRLAEISKVVHSGALPEIFYTNPSTWPLPYRYPLPSRRTHKLGEVPNYAAFLSCTTRKAVLVVRDIHRCYNDPRGLNAFATTAIVHRDKLPRDLCSVATLETKNGSWAGVLRPMHGKLCIYPGMEIQTISISTGSTTNKEAGRCYEEHVDIKGSGEGSYFSSMASGKTPDWKSGDYNPFKGEPRDRGPLFELYGGPRPQQTPDEACKAFLKGGEPLTEKDQERYEFHNILWVETRDGIMYRKAAGRVPKEIWEKNCGDPEQIVLG